MIVSYLSEQDTSVYLVFLAVFLLSYYIINIEGKRLRLNLPPGPTPLPVIGNLLHLRGNSREAIQRLSDKYGDIITVYKGSRPVVYLCKHDIITEAFKNPVFAGRPKKGIFFEDILQFKGLTAREGKDWREQRKFVVKTLRELGVGRQVLEQKTQEEIIVFIKELEKDDGKIIDPFYAIHAAVSNVIYNIVFGSRFDYDDPTFKNWERTNEELVSILAYEPFLQAFPFLRNAPGDPVKMQLFGRLQQGLLDQWQAKVDEHKQSFVKGHIRDVIDAFINEVNVRSGDPDTTFTDSNLKFLISDLYGAGQDTTVVALRWLLLFLIHYPEVMSSVHKEIDAVLGRDQPPSMQHKAMLPYCEAVVLETLRLADVVTHGVPHKALEDVTFHGYRIPAGMEVIGSLCVAHRDPLIWDEPDLFKPERFLDEHGIVVKNEYLAAFSMGKRACPGEALGRMEVFLFFLSMMQHFNISNPSGQPLPELKGNDVITNAPLPFKIHIKKRYSN